MHTSCTRKITLPLSITEATQELYSATSWTSTKCATSWRLNEKTARMHEKLCVICGKKDDGPVRRSHIIQHNSDKGFHELCISKQQCHIKGTVCAYVVYRQCPEHIVSEVISYVFNFSNSSNIHMKIFSVLCWIQPQDSRTYTFIKIQINMHMFLWLSRWILYFLKKEGFNQHFLRLTN
jgi:hypothetical protein